jgi:molybdenum cofactor cytidylyltransferase
MPKTTPSVGVHAGPNQPEHPAAVVLAAGAAVRMGGRPKCLLELNGVSLLRRLCLALSDSGLREVVVVGGHDAERVRQSVQDLPVQWVLNPRFEEGQITSLRCGLQALSSNFGAVLVALSDQPLITSQDLSDLMQAFARRPVDTQVVQPHVAGLPGNPVMFSAAVRAQILAGPDSMGCREWQLAHPQQVFKWPTVNTRYRTDVDSPADIAALRDLSGQQLRWPTDLA